MLLFWNARLQVRRVFVLVFRKVHQVHQQERLHRGKSLFLARNSSAVKPILLLGVCRMFGPSEKFGRISFFLSDPVRTGQIKFHPETEVFY